MDQVSHGPEQTTFILRFPVGISKLHNLIRSHAPHYTKQTTVRCCTHPIGLSRLHCTVTHDDVESITRYRPRYRQNLTAFPDCTIGQHNFRKCFYYRNDTLVKSCFDQIHACCRKIIFVAMPYNWPEFYDKTVMMNQVYSSFADETIHLPMDPDFPKRCTVYTEKDRVHYTDQFAMELTYLVEAALLRV